MSFLGAPPALLFGALLLCLMCSALGFWRTVYFVSLGYAISIAGQAVAAAVVYRTTLAGWPLAQLVALALYGLRLGSFVIVRDESDSYRQELRQTRKQAPPMGAWTGVAVWVGVSVMYVLMFLPAQLVLAAQSRGLALWSAPAGVALMVLGLALEAAADWQKSAFKRRYPEKICTSGLFRLVRCPNYLGEMLFWLGSWAAGTAAYGSTLDWVLATLGLLCIEGVMLGATLRLERKRNTRYGADPAYQVYVHSVPVLFPLVPLYSLARSPAPR